jgi:hypothetical protein
MALLAPGQRLPGRGPLGAAGYQPGSGSLGGGVVLPGHAGGNARPRPLTVMPWSLAQARMSELRSRLPPARPAGVLDKGRGCARNAVALLVLRSIW